MRVHDYAAAMAAYNRWMNEKLYAAAAELSDEERKRDLGAAFRSIHGTLNHLVLTDEAWLQRFRGAPVTMKSPDQELYVDFAELSEARCALDAEIDAWANSVTEEFAAGDFRVFSVSYNRQYVLPGWAAVVHFFNHQTHHRGQATTLLAQLGKDAGVTDLPLMPFFNR
jgi:uncharacterized damage-inducible protein DinB